MSLLWVTAARRTYYHGSDEEFEPGDLVLPQAESGAKNWGERVGHDGPQSPFYTGEHVHHVAEPWRAEMFGRHVYEVNPLTDVERDPEDFGEGWTRNKGPARVVRLHHSIPRSTGL